MKSFVSLVLVPLICVQIGDSYHFPHHFHQHSGVPFNKAPQVPEQVFVGIPLIFQQRRDLAKELGVNPFNVMGNRNDYMFHDHHPLEDVGPRHRLPAAFTHFHQSHRIMKRGIIWNKIKKIKKSISSIHKKIWKIKAKTVKVLIGPPSTVRPSYASTGGSWGYRGVRPSMASYSYAGNPSGSAYGASMHAGWSNAASSWGYFGNENSGRATRTSLSGY